MACKIELEALLKGCADDSYDDGIRIDTELVPLAGPGGPVKISASVCRRGSRPGLR